MARLTTAVPPKALKRVSRVLLLQFGAILFLLLVAVLIRPGGLSANDGFSYYGDYADTALPYGAAFVLYAYSLWRLSEFAGFASRRFLVIALRSMALFVIGLLITPSSLANGIHMVFGATLFSLQLIISIWVGGWLARNAATISLVLIELAGGLMSFYYLPKQVGLLLQGQAIFQFAFWLLLLRLVAVRERSNAS